MRDRRTLMEAVRNQNSFFFIGQNPKSGPKSFESSNLFRSRSPNKRPKVNQNHRWEWRELSGFSEMELWCQEEPFDRKYADCKDPVKCLNSGKYPPFLFKLFKNMHIRRWFNYNITKNAQICEQTTDVIFSALTDKESGSGPFSFTWKAFKWEVERGDIKISLH